MRQMKQLVLATALTTAWGSSHAFDGDRRSFMIGVGGGFHTTDFEAKSTGFAGSSRSESGAEFRLMIGSGISEQLTVYGVYDIQQDGEAVYGMLGPGATFYLRGAGPSAYLFGGVGLARFSISDGVPSGPNVGDEYEPVTGFGLLFGGGYAFTQGFHLDASLMYLDITDDENFASNLDYELTSLRVTASYTWF